MRENGLTVLETIVKGKKKLTKHHRVQFSACIQSLC